MYHTVAGVKSLHFRFDIVAKIDQIIVIHFPNLPPEGHEPSIIYKSNGPADQVLEVNGGYTEQKGIKVGDMIIVNQ